MTKYYSFSYPKQVTVKAKNPLIVSVRFDYLITSITTQKVDMVQLCTHLSVAFFQLNRKSRRCRSVSRYNNVTRIMLHFWLHTFMRTDVAWTVSAQSTVKKIASNCFSVRMISPEYRTPTRTHACIVCTRCRYGIINDREDFSLFIIVVVVIIIIWQHKIRE